MNAAEWCAIVHVDFRPSFGDSQERQKLLDALARGIPPSFEAGEQVLRDLVEDSDYSTDTIDIAVLQQQRAGNHFDVVSRFGSESGYEAHLVSPANLAYRRGIADALGSPYEDRLHSARGEQSWPRANLGDFVVITQLEVQSPRHDDALRIVDELVAVQAGSRSMTGQVLLQRHFRPSNLELISVWSSPEAFEEHLESSAAQSTRSALDRLLVAPIDDRRHFVFAGAWSTP